MAAVATAAAHSLPSVFIQGGTPTARAEVARDLTAFRSISEPRHAALVLLLGWPHDDPIARGRAIQTCRRENPGSLILVLSCERRLDTFVDAFRSGVNDCLHWPAERGRLQEWCERVTRRPGGTVVLGSSAIMKEVRASLRQLAVVNCRVLLCGETGTGKEVAARSVHEWSTRAGEPFVTINCPAIPETLFER